MYQVYTQPRPGRPTLAIVSTASLLVLTVGMAWGVIRYKSQVQQVQLGDPQVFADGGIRCRLPSGWEAKSGDLPPRVVASLMEPIPPEGNVRQLLLFRGPAHSLSLPSTDAVTA